MNAKEIINMLRSKHGSIRQFAIRNRYAREVVYSSAKGAGSIKCRLEIAQILGKKPSEIWPERSERINERDDSFYMFNIKG